MKLLFKIIIYSNIFISCKHNNNNKKQDVSALENRFEKKLNPNVLLKKNTILNKKEILSDLNMQKDTVYILKKDMFFVDIGQTNGFLRTYYCGNRPINSLKVEGNKIIEGLYLDAIAENDTIKAQNIQLINYKDGLKDGPYLGITTAMTPTDFRFYKKGAKSGRWLTYITNGKKSGTVCKEIYKNNKEINSDCDYYEWNKEASKFLKDKKMKSIREFIFCLYGSDFYKT